MVERLLNFFQREFRGLHEAALLLGVSAFVSQLLALFRDRLLASTFGAGATLDIYYAAFRLPDLLYVSLASFVSVTVVLPFLVKRLTEGQSAASRLMTDLFSRFSFLMLVAMGVLYLLLPWLTALVAPGFDQAARSELLNLSRILLLSPLFLGLSNLFANITQASQKFFLFALSPILYNLGIIGGILYLYPIWGTSGLAWGVVIGAFLHLLIQWPAIVRGPLGWQWLRFYRWGGSEWKKILIIAWPRTLALSANQLSVLVLIAFASGLSVGSIAVFNFAYNLQGVLLSIIGVSYSVAAFPSLVRLFADEDQAKFIYQVSSAVRHIIFWSLPAFVLFLVLRAQIVRVVLGFGEFGWRDTRLTAATLALFLFSVTAQSLALLFVRAYYAGGQTKKPLLVNSLTAVITVTLAWLFLRLVESAPGWLEILGGWLRVADIKAIEILVLPLAFTIAALINLLIFWKLFQRDFGPFPSLVYQSLRQSIVASLAVGGVAYWLLAILAPYFDQATFWGIFNQGWWAGLGGILAGFLVLQFLGNEELTALNRSLKHKFWRRSHPILPESEGL